MEINEFKSEWCLLQNQFDSYEKHSLYIKLLSIIVLLVAEVTGVISIYIVLVLLVLWVQDGIWKTFQSRMEPRLLQIEKTISERSGENGGENSSENSEERAFQFNSEYQKASLSGVSLINEYARQSIRPTVAFPHAVLVLVMSIQCLL